MAVKRDESGTEAVMIAEEYGICTSRTGFMVEPFFLARLVFSWFSPTRQMSTLKNQQNRIFG